MRHHLLIVKLGSTFPRIAERHGDFDDWIISGLGLHPDKIEVAKPYAGDQLPDPRKLSGVVITGSHAMVTDQENWSEYTAGWIQTVIEAETPLLGICYGHQLIAHAMGVEVGLNQGGSEFGTVDTRLSEKAVDDVLFNGLPQVVRVQTCHSQFVLELPAGARLLASSDRDPHHALAYGAAAWGVQFHPEFNRAILNCYIRECADLLQTEGQDPEALLRSTSNTPVGQELLRRFGKIVRDKA